MNELFGALSLVGSAMRVVSVREGRVCVVDGDGVKEDDLIVSGAREEMNAVGETILGIGRGVVGVLMEER